MFFSFIPDTLPWLVQNGKNEKLNKSVKKSSIINRKKIPTKFNIESQGDDKNIKKKKGNMLHLFSSRKIAIMTLNFIIIW